MRRAGATAVAWPKAVRRLAGRSSIVCGVRRECGVPGWTGEAKSAPEKTEDFAAVLQRAGEASVGFQEGAVPFVRGGVRGGGRRSGHGITRVQRVVAVYDVGRIVNAQTARSQFIGGIVCGISLVLQEKTDVDWRSGRILNHNLADSRVRDLPIRPEKLL